MWPAPPGLLAGAPNAARRWCAPPLWCRAYARRLNHKPLPSAPVRSVVVGASCGDVVPPRGRRLNAGGCPPLPHGAAAWPWSGCGTGGRGEIQGGGRKPAGAGGDSAPPPQVAPGPLPRRSMRVLRSAPPAPARQTRCPSPIRMGAEPERVRPHILRGVSPRAPWYRVGQLKRRVRTSPISSVARDVVLRRASPSIVGGNFIMPVKGKGRWRAPSKGPLCGPLAALDRHEAQRSTNERRSRQ